MNEWVWADNDYSNPSRPTISDLRFTDMVNWPGSRYEVQVRYRFIDKSKRLADVEVWSTYAPKKAGIGGKPRSQLLARFKVRGITGDSRMLYWYKDGRAESWYMSGKRRGEFEYIATGKGDKASSDRVFGVTYYEENGRIEEYLDHRGDTKREARFGYVDGKRKTVLWRNKRIGRQETYSSGMKVLKAIGPEPLDEATGDYTVSTYAESGWLKEEIPMVAGKPHGFSRTYNKFGRVIAEDYHINGTYVPDWVYLDPKGVTAEEIQGEENEKLRDIMVQLQGAELYQVRAMARSPKAVSRARILETDVVVGEVNVERTVLVRR